MVVIMLTPESGKFPGRKAKHRIIEQRDRQFAPHLLAVPVGSTVSFPNFDPIFHNVFSVSPTKAFDLGIYKDGETREVTFTKEGVVQLGCNLHANMSSYVVVVAAPHYVVVGSDGTFRFNKLAPGKYNLRAWSDRSAEVATKPVEILPGANNLTMDLVADRAGDLGMDKFGKSRGAR
jgi:plastocyanin